MLNKSTNDTLVMIDFKSINDDEMGYIFHHGSPVMLTFHDEDSRYHLQMVCMVLSLCLCNTVNCQHGAFHDPTRCSLTEIKYSNMEKVALLVIPDSRKLCRFRTI